MMITAKTARAMARDVNSDWMAKRLDTRAVIVRYDGLLNPDRQPPPAGPGIEALYRNGDFWVGVLGIRKAELHQAIRMAELVEAAGAEADQLSRQVRDLERIAKHARTGCDVTWLPEFRRWRAGRTTRLFGERGAA